VDELRELVASRRRALGLSIRQAAAKGGLSNQAWGGWENPTPGKPAPKLTPRLQSAIAVALDWPIDWPENPPRPASRDVRAQLREQAEALQWFSERLQDAEAKIERLLAATPTARAEGEDQP
jgi:transcriptional regulator with XRE-family HTH domain